jgi:GTPase SAR1 family protein
MDDFMEVSEAKAKKFANSNDALFHCISAKTGEGLDELFLKICRKVLNISDDDGNDEEKKKKIQEKVDELIEKGSRSEDRRLKKPYVGIVANKRGCGC